MEKLIWNDSETLFFKASEFSGARIDHIDHLHNNEYVIRIYLRGIIRSVYRENEAGSLRYEVFTDEESAKKCLAELAKKIE